MDFAQARYLKSNFGRFSSPDDFRNDTINSNPQSWNLYAYVQNNPVNFVDPFGEKTFITVNYNQNTGITTISISASFAVYGAANQGFSQEDLLGYATLMVEGIMQTYNTAFGNNGQGYVMETQISVDVFGSEEDAIASGADNLVELGNHALIDDSGNEISGIVSRRDGENFDRMRVSIHPPYDPASSMSYYNSADHYRRVFAHEFGHLLGIGDQRSGFMESGGGETTLQNEDFMAFFGRNVEKDIPAPPSSAKAVRNNLRFGSGKSALSKVTGMDILGTNSPSFLLRRAQGLDTARWVARNK